MTLTVLNFIKEPKPVPHLDITIEPKRYKDSHTIVAYGLRRKRHKFQPEFHVRVPKPPNLFFF